MIEQNQKQYTEEAMLKAMGINETLIQNEETKIALIKMLSTVKEVEFSNIHTQEEFGKALEIYGKNIEVGSDGNSIFWIDRLNETAPVARKIELRENNIILRDGVSLRKKKDEKGIVSRILQSERIFELKEDGEDILLEQNRREKIVKTPGNDESISRQEMEDVYYTKEWDEEEEIYNGWRNVRDVLHDDDKANSSYEDKVKSFKQGLKDSAEQDKEAKLNPKVVENKEVLKRNILEALGVNKKILDKPELTSQLIEVVDYANGGQELQTVEQVEKAMETLKQTLEITQEGVAGIKANRRYINVQGYAYDVTEGIKINIVGDEYEVENLKMGRGFQDEKGNIEKIQQNKKNRYRENTVDSSKVELMETQKKDMKVYNNVGMAVEKQKAGEVKFDQYQYLIQTIPSQLMELENTIAKSEYKTTWKDTRTKEEQKAEDLLQMQEEQKQELEERE